MGAINWMGAKDWMGAKGVFRQDAERFRHGIESFQTIQLDSSRPVDAWSEDSTVRDIAKLPSRAGPAPTNLSPPCRSAPWARKNGGNNYLESCISVWLSNATLADNTWVTSNNSIYQQASEERAAHAGT